MSTIRKAVITAAGRDQRSLMMQGFIDRNGRRRTALGILLTEAGEAGCEQVAVITAPGDEAACASAVGEAGVELRIIPQAEPLGYGHAVLLAREFVGDDPFLHLVGDHLWVSSGEAGCARQMVEVASHHGCAVSGVQATRERELPNFGVVAGQLVAGHDGLYQIERVVEKPSPTLAEQILVVPGLRAGRYLCFFGLHVLTPAVFAILAGQLAGLAPGARLALSPALESLAARERYLAYEVKGQRYDLGAPYGILTAQLALALAGHDREEVLAQLVELLAQSR
jgi:UTP--glucose-1-phosphate uridylyltransferase